MRQREAAGDRHAVSIGDACLDAQSDANPIIHTAPAPPLVVTLRDSGPAGSPWTAVQLSLVGEDGIVAATVNDPGGIDGDAYFVGAAHLYFIEGTAVKAMGRTVP